MSPETVNAPVLAIKPPEACRYDLVSLGEVMIRFDPGATRVRDARTFDVSEGGGEYNVARAFAATFGMRSAVVTGLVRNELGELLLGLIRRGGVDPSFIVWKEFDGVGDNARIGLNFTERGFGPRPAMGVSDRGHSAASRIRPEEVDWERIFVDEGVRWLHTGGIFAALSTTSAEVTRTALRAARESGTVVSYDLNYRPSLWTRQGGRSAAVRVNEALMDYVDVIIGNEEDFSAALGFDVEGVGDDIDLTDIDVTAFTDMLGRVGERYPNVKLVATTLRNATTANRNDWSAMLWDGTSSYKARERSDLEIYDRVGGGDGFASGMIYALMSGRELGDAVEFGAAHGALVMSTPGDVSMVSTLDVERAVHATGARVIR